VNLGVAKDQRLSLNPSQISGACGRLMCSLRYEHEFYVQSRRRFPKEGRLLRTRRGEEKVIANDIFRDRVTLRGSDGETRTVSLADLRREVEEVARELGLPVPTIGHALTAAAGGAAHRGAPARETAPAEQDHEPPVQASGAGDSEGTDTLPDLGEDGDAEGPDASAAAGEADAGESAQPLQTGAPRQPGDGRPRRRRGRRGGRRNRSAGPRPPRGPAPDAANGDGQ
jgi:hypothetical protein